MEYSIFVLHRCGSTLASPCTIGERGEQVVRFSIQSLLLKEKVAAEPPDEVLPGLPWHFGGAGNQAQYVTAVQASRQSFYRDILEIMKVELGSTELLTEQTYRMVIEYYVYYYNNLRPHSSLGYVAPLVA